MLPPVPTFETYVVTKDDPQRFYMLPDNETFSDWRVRVGDITMPVHSMLLASECKVFNVILSDCLRCEEIEIDLSEHSLDVVLLLMRLIYNSSDLCPESMQCVRTHCLVNRLIRVADFVQYRRMDGLLECLLSGASMRDLEPVWTHAHETNNAALIHACYEHAWKWCTSCTWCTSDDRSMRQRLAEIPDDPVFLKMALLASCRFKTSTVDRVRSILNGVNEDDSADVTVTVYVAKGVIENCHEWFTMHKKRFRVEVTSDLDLVIKRGEFCPGEFAFTLRVVHPIDPSKSRVHGIRWTRHVTSSTWTPFRDISDAEEFTNSSGSVTFTVTSGDDYLTKQDGDFSSFVGLENDSDSLLSSDSV